LPAKKPIADGRSPTERLQPWLIAGLSVVLLSMAIISTWMVMALSQAAELRAESYRHLSALSRVVSSLRDAEAIQRGYLISGNEKYLAPYQRARQEIDRQFSQLHALTRDDSDQMPRIKALQAVATARLVALDGGLASRRERGAEAANALVDPDRDEHLMTSIRTLAAAIQEADQQTLALREQAVARQRHRSIAALWILTTVAFLMAVATSFQFHRDLMRWRKAGQALRFAAEHDHLTGLSNRREFDLRLGQCVNRAQRDHSHFALASVDVDRFKQINDAFGHPAGYQILRAIAGRLREHCRDGDLLARVGGEEFAVILHGLGTAGALAIAERLRSGVAAQPVRYTIGGSVGQVAVTVSVGVSSFPEHGSTPEKILEAADHALYAAKSAGRNRVEIAGKHFPQKSRPWSATSTSET
jgi:diguanylate cyclase (GGDEF)-like protein